MQELPQLVPLAKPTPAPTDESQGPRPLPDGRGQSMLVGWREADDDGAAGDCAWVLHESGLAGRLRGEEHAEHNGHGERIAEGSPLPRVGDRVERKQELVRIETRSTPAAAWRPAPLAMPIAALPATVVEAHFVDGAGETVDALQLGGTYRFVLEWDIPVSGGDRLVDLFGPLAVIGRTVARDDLPEWWPTTAAGPVELVLPTSAMEGERADIARLALGSLPVDLEVPPGWQLGAIHVGIADLPAQVGESVRLHGPYSLVTKMPLRPRQSPPAYRETIMAASIGPEHFRWLHARGLLDLAGELRTIKCNDVDGRVALDGALVLRRAGETDVAFPHPRIGRTTTTTALITHELHTFGLDMVADDTGIRLLPMDGDAIRSVSHGEPRKPETVNYRTYDPEPKGLFCPDIFGRDETPWRCRCGGLVGTDRQGDVCARCNLPVEASWPVSPVRAGHINLAESCVAAWAQVGSPSVLSIVAGVPDDVLARVTFMQDFVARAPDGTVEVVTEMVRRMLPDDHEDLGTGGDAIRAILQGLADDGIALRTAAARDAGETFTADVLQAWLDGRLRPDHLVIDAVAVMPAFMRPLVMLASGNFATADINDLYRRLINRNNRLRKLTELKAPEVIIRNERRQLQMSVNQVAANGALGTALHGDHERPLVSAGMLAGARLADGDVVRLDWSGRARVLVDPATIDGSARLPEMISALKHGEDAHLVLYREDDADAPGTVVAVRSHPERSPDAAIRLSPGDADRLGARHGDSVSVARLHTPAACADWQRLYADPDLPVVIDEAALRADDAWPAPATGGRPHYQWNRHDEPDADGLVAILRAVIHCAMKPEPSPIGPTMHYRVGVPPAVDH